LVVRQATCESPTDRPVLICPRYTIDTCDRQFVCNRADCCGLRRQAAPYRCQRFLVNAALTIACNSSADCGLKKLLQPCSLPRMDRERSACMSSLFLLCDLPRVIASPLCSKSSNAFANLAGNGPGQSSLHARRI